MGYGAGTVCHHINPEHLKGQALAYFIIEFTYKKEVKEILHLQLLPPQDPSTSQPQESPHLLPEVPIWIIHAFGASNKHGSSATILLINPERDTLETVFWFHFWATSNEAKYEAILVSLKITKDLRADQVLVCEDSSVVIG